MRKPLILVAALTTALLLGGVALAAIPDSQGVIHACRKNNGGALRVIDTDAGQTCTSNETALNWSQTGPQGATGPQGPAGVSGHEVVVATFTARANDLSTAAVACPTGKKVTGGGYTVGSFDPAVTVRDSAPQTPANIAWVVSVRNDTGTDVTTNQVFAVCATVS